MVRILRGTDTVTEDDMTLDEQRALWDARDHLYRGRRQMIEVRHGKPHYRHLRLTDAEEAAVRGHRLREVELLPVGLRQVARSEVYRWSPPGPRL